MDQLQAQGSPRHGSVHPCSDRARARSRSRDLGSLGAVRGHGSLVSCFFLIVCSLVPLHACVRAPLPSDRLHRADLPRDDISRIRVCRVRRSRRPRWVRVRTRGCAARRERVPAARRREVGEDLPSPRLRRLARGLAFSDLSRTSKPRRARQGAGGAAPAPAGSRNRFGLRPSLRLADQREAPQRPFSAVSERDGAMPGPRLPWPPSNTPWQALPTLNPGRFGESFYGRTACKGIASSSRNQRYQCVDR